jgi:Fe-S-cluster containining protein
VANELFWKIVKEFNYLMKSAIEGPLCIDPSICRGDCCSIKIDVPKVLAKEYIKRGYATKEDFIRSNVFSFHLRFDEEKGKCFLFDKKINGCSVHDSGIKPPQCYIYPTNFSNPDLKAIDCKKAGGWKIVDTIKAKEAERLLEKIVFLCQLEAKKELKKIEKRIGKSSGEKSLENLKKLKASIRNVAPSQLAGFKDSWDHFLALHADGLSLQVKRLCKKLNPECEYRPEDYFECKYICDTVANGLIDILHNNLLAFVKEHGVSEEGKYPLYKMV